ncbi:MAG: hypothetical protein ACLQM8_19810 [Limisphaerales bacterium]
MNESTTAPCANDEANLLGAMDKVVITLREQPSLEAVQRVRLAKEIRRLSVILTTLYELRMSKQMARQNCL